MAGSLRLPIPPTGWLRSPVVLLSVQRLSQQGPQKCSVESDDMNIDPRHQKLVQQEFVALPDTTQLGIFWVTRRIAIGRFATPQRRKHLLDCGVTHILNVSDTPSLPDEESRFQSIVDCPVVDLAPIPLELALQAIELISRILKHPDSKLFIHCIAGQNRSPSILFLYLLASGFPANDAEHLITSRSPDSIPHHKILISPPLIEKMINLALTSEFHGDLIN